MRKDVLVQYVEAQQEVKDLLRRIQSLNDKLLNMEVSGYMVSDSVTCGKKGKKPLSTTKITGFPYPEYNQKKEKLKTYKLQLELFDAKLLDLLNQVEEYIESIDNSRMRRIMRYKYIDGLNWVQVAYRMGGNHTADGCRNAHDRYLGIRK